MIDIKKNQRIQITLPAGTVKMIEHIAKVMKCSKSKVVAAIIADYTADTIKKQELAVDKTDVKA
jgi:hypothetical protein